MRIMVANERSDPLRLLYCGAALLVGLLLAGSFLMISHLRETALNDQERNLSTLSLTLAEQAERTFQSVDLVVSSTLSGLTKSGVVDDASLYREAANEQFYRALRQRMTGLQQLDAVVVEDSTGKVVNFSRFWPVPDIQNADRDYFQALKNDPRLTSFISEPVRNRGSGTWSIMLARPIRAPDGRFIGLVLGVTQLRYFEDFYRAIVPPGDSSIAIQRSDGVMLARFPVSDAIGKKFSPAAHLLQNGTSGLVLEPSPIDGKMRIKAAHRLGSYPVVALATESEDNALATWRGVALLIGVAALGCSLSIAAAAFAMGRQWKQHALLSRTRAELRRKKDVDAALEEMRLAKEQAEMADTAKSEFLANISHELRTPLNAIIGFSEVMAGECLGPMGSERYREYANDVHSSGKHLLAIINDILDLSKAASGKLEPDRSWFDIRETVEAAVRLVKERVERAGLSLRLNLPAGNPTIYADQRLIKQMLLNLLSNACKFTPQGGRIECSVVAGGETMTFSVSDTGIGIAPDYIDEVVKPFVQLESSLNRQHQGTGLGLSLVKMMAEQHGGTFRIDSELGVGTTVTITLPHCAGAPPRSEAEAPLAAIA